MNKEISDHTMAVMLAKEVAELKPKADAYDAMCEVGLIQYGEDPATRIYSVWGFTCWHHDEDILKAIAAAMDPVRLIPTESKV